ncbi:predicted protein [Naegleria gruberi]|uniref:Predicted protein n=1 Tax=Naegleria gruberi TaxID=5762 RepID=D2W240_NAEGR|nr:uncharacterized protein NAEGRDRAFT_82096 [Naegleria gruberi]EFC36877.1 predicted protein [Naegleria gruberi]|eukprot:XP_002669621.1 predicted protein [Naegleria gruberi strain NEG-M]
MKQQLFTILLLLISLLSFTLAHDGHKSLVFDWVMMSNESVTTVSALDLLNNEEAIEIRVPRVPIGGDNSKRAFLKFSQIATQPYFLTFDTSSLNTSCLIVKSRIGAKPRTDRPSTSYKYPTELTQFDILDGGCDFYIEFRPDFYNPSTENASCIAKFEIIQSLCENSACKSQNGTCADELAYEARMNDMSVIKTSWVLICLLFALVAIIFN